MWAKDKNSKITGKKYKSHEHNEEMLKLISSNAGRIVWIYKGYFLANGTFWRQPCNIKYCNLIYTNTDSAIGER
jgi:hypothetical protein